MKISYLLLFTSIIFLSFSIVGKAQAVGVVGEVSGENPVTNWNVTVTMRILGANTSQKKWTKKTYYNFSAAKNAKITISFKATSYSPYTTDIYDASDEVEIPPVVLQKTGTLLAIGKADEALDNNQAYYIATGDFDGAAYDLTEIKVESEGLPDSAAIKSKVDVRFNNLKNYMKQINKPVTTQQELRWQLYENVIIQNKNKTILTVPVEKQRSYLDATQDDDVPPNISFEVVRALVNTPLDPKVKEIALKRFREQASDPKSVMFSNSLYALAKIGTPDDKRGFIIRYARGSDYQSSLAAVLVIKDAEMLEGSEALRDLAMNKTTNAVISQSAVEGLDVFANKLNDARSKTYLNKIPVQQKTSTQLQVIRSQ